MEAMRFRAAHFACLLVLLSAFGAADAASHQGACRDCAALQVFLQQIAVTSAPAAATRSQASPDEHTTLPPAQRTRTALSWAMRPPAAQTVAQHAATGSGL
jgi:hypothetical protein